MCPNELGAVLYAEMDSETVPGAENMPLPLPLVELPLYMYCWPIMLPMPWEPDWNPGARWDRTSCDPK